MLTVPEHPFGLMAKVYRDIFPLVHQELDIWKQKSESIYNSELKAQATASIRDKTFHCEGGGILALLSGNQKQKCVEFIIAYQTISDYLDNLCDRSTSLDPQDFRMLHTSMQDALTVEQNRKIIINSEKNRMTADICMNWSKRASVFLVQLSTTT